MDILRHLLIALTYTAFAVALAVTLPYTLPNLAGGDALLIGGFFFVISAIPHEVFARFERDGTMGTQLAAFDELRDELTEELQRAPGSQPRSCAGLGQPRQVAEKDGGHRRRGPHLAKACRKTFLKRTRRGRRGTAQAHRKAPRQRNPASPPTSSAWARRPFSSCYRTRCAGIASIFSCSPSSPCRNASRNFTRHSHAFARTMDPSSRRIFI